MKKINELEAILDIFFLVLIFFVQIYRLVSVYSKKTKKTGIFFYGKWIFASNFLLFLHFAYDPVAAQNTFNFSSHLYCPPQILSFHPRSHRNLPDMNIILITNIWWVLYFIDRGRIKKNSDLEGNLNSGHKYCKHSKET